LEPRGLVLSDARDSFIVAVLGSGRRAAASR
jgi:hypothetical protein